MHLSTQVLLDQLKSLSSEILEKKIYELKIKISSRKGAAQIGVEQNDEKIELLLYKIYLKGIRNKSEATSHVMNKYNQINQRIIKLKKLMEQSRKSGRLRLFDSIRRKVLDVQNEIIMYLFDEGMEDDFKEQATKHAILLHHPFDLKPHAVFSILPVFSPARSYSFEYNEKIMKFPVLPFNIRSNDKKMANFINDYLSLKNSPVKNCNVGELMVKYGRKYGVDPLVLLAISAYETGYGKLKKDATKIIGLDFNGKEEQTSYNEIERQVHFGALNFRNMRLKAGLMRNDPLEFQLLKINRSGWSRNPGWHKGVLTNYSRIVAEANRKEFKLA